MPPHHPERFPLALLIAFCAAGLFYPALRLPRRARVAVLLAACAVILLAPLLVPAHARVARVFLSMTAFALVAKLYDLHVDAEMGSRPSWRSFLAFLPSPFALVWRKVHAEPRPPPRQDMLRVIIGAAGFAAGAAVLAALFHIDWRRYPFALEHCAKVPASFATAMGLGAAVAAAIRLAGGEARDAFGNIFAARTPADFWRRYNRPTGQWLYENIFKPLGGSRRPVLGTLLTFAVSAIIHEYVFAIPIGRVQGYQTAFFMIQGLAVAATLRWRPRGAMAAIGIAATFAFNLASAVLFFASINGVAPFYVVRNAGIIRFPR